jgi:hypothetical protein
MLAQICNSTRFRIARASIAAAAILTFASCATHSDPQLVSDPSGQQESALPWNQQQKWENQGQFGPVAEQMTGGRR